VAGEGEGGRQKNKVIFRLCYNSPWKLATMYKCTQRHPGKSSLFVADCIRHIRTSDLMWNIQRGYWHSPAHSHILHASVEFLQFYTFTWQL